METVRWAEVGALFAELAEAPADVRRARLEQTPDPELKAEVLSLLNAHDGADGFFEDEMPRLFASLVASSTAIAPEPCRLEIGATILHFEIQELLGEGALARVYLARDLELERLVALKVTLDQNSEARTLAHFQLDGIIQVFSEHVAEHREVLLRLICLEFVAGPNLATLAESLASHQTPGNFIQVLDANVDREVALDPAALAWRERMQALTMAEAITLLGYRLAEIVGHVHERGVLHLDIKPANILIDPYGRPFLSDFNVSARSALVASQDPSSLGGTRRYMPPEQASLFEGGRVDLDERCDVYALGLVLKELLEAAHVEDPALLAILTRATAQDRDQRQGSARGLAAELCTWLQRRLTDDEMPAPWAPVRWILRAPLAALIVFTLASQLFATTINILYNHLEIVSALKPDQIRAFIRSVVFYNSISYPLSIASVLYFMRPLYLKPVEPSRALKTVLLIPPVLLACISIAWLPGAWIFPYSIDAMAGPLGPEIYWQFKASLWLGWLLSMTTTLTLVLYVLSRAMYPKYWSGESEKAARELRFFVLLNRSMTFFSALIPMTGVLIVVGLAPPDYTVSAYHSLRVLLLVTVGLGLLNLVLMQRITQGTEAVIAVLKRPRSFLG